ncbi:hypothetical protein HY639_04430 [Candidatus Woesearchaeota archaeon]|nr:hypothetical protein [Candidatus Woesearchaeota archaeon]
MKWGVLLLFLVFALVPVATAQTQCEPGFVYSRGSIRCIQKHCIEAGAGYTYVEDCLCWVSEWGGDPKVTCRNEKGLVTHCLPEGQKCEDHPAAVDPVTGNCAGGFSKKDGKCVAGTDGTKPSGTASSSGTQSGGTTQGAPGGGTAVSPAPPKSPEERCKSKSNTVFVDGRCKCQEGYKPNVARTGCVTPEEFGNEYCPQKFANSVYDKQAKKCVCPKGTQKSPDRKSCIKEEIPAAAGQPCNDKKPCPSTRYQCEEGQCTCRDGYRLNADRTKCVTQEEYGNEVCPKKFPGAVYDAAQKKCTCPPDTVKGPDGKSCIKGGATGLGAACDDVKKCPPKYVCGPEKKCICADGYRLNVAKDDCVTMSEYGNEACPLKYPNTRYDETAKKCVCLDGYVKSDDGKLCVLKGDQAKPCQKTEECADDELCDPTTKKCQKVPCDCGEVSNHACKSYDCCDDTKCGDDQKCNQETHACQKVECPCGEIKNHACEAYDCCKKEDCAADETCTDNKCAKVDCPCGEIKDHVCNPYKCCDDTHCSPPTDSCDTSKHECIASEGCTKLHDSGDAASKMDITIVPSKFPKTDKDKWIRVARSTADHILDYEPFKSNKAKVNVNRADKWDADMSCAYQAAPGDPADHSADRLLVCNDAQAKAVANVCGYEYVLLVHNSAQYGGAGGGIATSYYSSTETAPILAHEFGHLLGLGDEYDYGLNSTVGGYSLRPNCDTAQPCARWNTIAGTACVDVCGYQNWYRSTAAGDVMRTHSQHYFSTVAQNHITTLLRGYS